MTAKQGKEPSQLTRPLDELANTRYTQVVLLPPSSSGLGHSPLKAKTGVRVPLGVLFVTITLRRV